MHSRKAIIGYMHDKNAKVQVAAREIVSLIHAGDLTRATNKLMSYSSDGKEGRFNLIRLLVSYAQQENDHKVVSWALDAFEKMKSKAPADKMLYYDIANGYQVLYEIEVEAKRSNAYDQEKILRAAIKYFEKAGMSPLALTNLGNLYDYIGRPVEAIKYYDLALKRDPEFGMALGNKAQALKTLAPVSGYQNAYLIKAYQLYKEALDNEESVKDIGGLQALENFQHNTRHLEEYFNKIGKPELLTVDLAHPHQEIKFTDELARFYTDFCFSNELYLNLHLSDKYSDASVGDGIFPILRTGKEEEEKRYVEDIAFRFNEISESFMSARMALVQSQYTNPAFSTVSEQTVLVDNLDYSVSNIYVGHLKMAYKEAFGTLDKIAVLLNHYLQLGRTEDDVYYHNVWFEEAENMPPIFEKVKSEQYLVGLYLLCQDLRGSKYSHLRNALTHRYARIYRGLSGPKGTYTFEELSETTIDVMYKVKCAITYLSLFITRKETTKYSGQRGLVMNMPLFTKQRLDIW